VTLFIFLAVALAAVAVLMLAWPFLKPRPEADGKAPARSMSAVATLAVAVPAAAFVLYFTLSDWPWDAQVQAHGADASASLTQMASQLEARLQREQGDADGWKLLGRTYVLMGDFPKAASAYSQANTLSGGADVEALLGLAEARVLVNETEFEGEAGRMFERALQLAPNEPKALWYGGLVSYRAQDLATARQRWSTLRDLAPPPELLQVIDARLAEIDATSGFRPRRPCRLRARRWLPRRRQARRRPQPRWRTWARASRCGSRLRRNSPPGYRPVPRSSCWRAAGRVVRRSRPYAAPAANCPSRCACRTPRP
jgi:cytochrome c-type biogenesis protein CcmH/NrfG